jgi:UDP-N-acetylglucosamine 4,6-dehydratase
MKKRDSGVLPITDPRMTRFNISLEEGVNLVFFALENAWGGEIFVPKIPSYRITDVATAIAPSCRQEVIGIRPGEKIHEEMITEADSYTTVDIGEYYAILPQQPIWSLEEYTKAFQAKAVEPGFQYNSGTNEDWLTVEQIRELVREYVDPAFEVKGEG